MSPNFQVYRAVIRKRIIEILKKFKPLEAVYGSRVTDYDPSVDPFPCASVYANDDDNDVTYQRDSMNTLKESQVTLQIQVVNTVDGDNVDDWPEAVEPLEAALLAYLRALDNERKIDDCIKWMTLSNSSSAIDVKGEIPVASSTMTFMVQYNEELAFEALEDFNSVGLTLVSKDNKIETGPIVVQGDENKEL